MYANILLSTDGSDVARKGVKYGMALAKALNAKVTVVTVTEPQPVDYGGGHVSGCIPSRKKLIIMTQPPRNKRAKSSIRLDPWRSGDGVTAEILHVPNAHPATAIVETAKSRGCDLIVMASHGRRGLRKLLLGSQTSEVLVDGSVPVLVVH